MDTTDAFRFRRFVAAMSGRARLFLVPPLTLLLTAALISLASLAGTCMSRPTGPHLLPIVEREFSKITSPPGARLLEPVSQVTQMEWAGVHGSYAAPISYDELRAHYDREAAAQGWRACGEKQTYDWYRDYGGMRRAYSKGELRAHLQYAGERARSAGYNWTFSFSVRWGGEPLLGRRECQ